jgi:hypothetical protein
MIVMANRLAHALAPMFRIQPCGPDKQPLVAGNRKDAPGFNVPPERFADDDLVGIIGGPLVPGFADQWHVIGIDLDKGFTRVELEDALGPLPETLTSKGWRHAYYLIPADHGLWQRNHALSCEGGHADIRPCPGGFLVEKGEWDAPLDLARIAVLPERALQRLRDALGEKPEHGAAPPPIAPAQLDDNDAQVAGELAQLWAPGTTGDQAFGALGGWLSRRGVSAERTTAIASEIAVQARSTHPDPVGRALQAYDGSCPLGRPALQAALARDADPGLVVETLDALEPLLAESVDGWLPPEAPPGPDPPPALPDLDVAWLSSESLAAPVPPVNWLVRELELAPGRCPVLAADSGAGKSWAVQSLALSVAAGRPVFGRFACRQGPVLHIAEDSDLEAVRDRYQRLARGMGVALAGLPLRVYGKSWRVTTAQGRYNPRAAQQLRETARHFGAALVIIDSLATVCVGLEENSPEIALPLYDTRDASTVFLWTHHTNKSGESYRGSTALRAAAGAMWSVSVGADGARTWKNEKHAERTDRKQALEGFATDWDGETIRFVATQAPPKERAADRAHLAMLRLVEQQGKATKAQLLRAAGGSAGRNGQLNCAVFDHIANPLGGQLVEVERGRFTLAPGVKVPDAAHELDDKLPDDTAKYITSKSNTARRK